MSQDLIAELDGYRAEAARYDRDGRDDRVAAVREQADRVAGLIKVEAEKADAHADNHEEAGQDLLAAKARVEAKRLRRALAELGEQETAADRTPRETAVPKKRGGNA